MIRICASSSADGSSGRSVAVEPPKLIVMLVYSIASVRLRTR